MGFHIYVYPLSGEIACVFRNKPTHSFDINLGAKGNYLWVNCQSPRVYFYPACGNAVTFPATLNTTAIAVASKSLLFSFHHAGKYCPSFPLFTSFGGEAVVSEQPLVSVNNLRNRRKRLIPFLFIHVSIFSTDSAFAAERV